MIVVAGVERASARDPEQSVRTPEVGGARATPVLVQKRAIRAFVRLRELTTTHSDLAKRLAELEEKTEALAMNHDTFSHNTRAQLRCSTRCANS
jgi:hypothetical protein